MLMKKKHVNASSRIANSRARRLNARERATASTSCSPASLSSVIKISRSSFTSNSQHSNSIIENSVVARGRNLAANIRRVTLRADEARVFSSLFYLDGDGHSVLVRRSLVASRTGSNRHVGLQSSERRGFGDIDMTGRAFRNMLVARVREFYRDAFGEFGLNIRRRDFMASGAVLSRRLLALPVAVETRSMARRSSLETARSWNERVGPVACIQLLLVRQVTDRAVVILLFIPLLSSLK